MTTGSGGGKRAEQHRQKRLPCKPEAEGGLAGVIAYFQLDVRNKAWGAAFIEIMKSTSGNVQLYRQSKSSQNTNRPVAPIKH